MPKECRGRATALWVQGTGGRSRWRWREYAMLETVDGTNPDGGSVAVEQRGLEAMMLYGSRGREMATIEHLAEGLGGRVGGRDPRCVLSPPLSP